MTFVSDEYRPIISFIVLFTGLTFSQNLQPSDIVEIKPSTTIRQTDDSVELRLYIRFTVKEGWHINSHELIDQFLIPTILMIDTSADYHCKDIVYPPATRTKLHYSKSELELYTGEQMIIAAISVPNSYRGNNVALQGKLQYQACNNENCLMPVKKIFSVSVKIHD